MRIARPVDFAQYDRFVVTRRHRVTVTPTLGKVDVYEFALTDGTPICRVRQRVARSNVRIGFLARDPLMYLDMPPRFDPWACCELVDPELDPIGGIRKAFTARRRRCHYVLSDRDGAEVARIEACVPAVVGRQRLGSVAVAAAAGVLGIPYIGAPGAVALASLALTGAVREVRDRVDPIEVAAELRLRRGDQTLGSFVRRPILVSGPSKILRPSESRECLYEIDLAADPAKTVDRRLALAVPVALDTLHGFFAESTLR